jgi:hypothetical protein
MNVTREGNESYDIPYAGGVHVKLEFTLRRIISAIATYPVNNSNDDHGILNEPVHLWGHCAPFNCTASVNTLSEKGRRILFPFIEGHGGAGRAPCFGTMDSMIYQAMYRLDWVTLASLLRSWVSNFNVSDTNPFTQPSLMHAGIPREYGELAIYVGQDTRYCRENFIRTSKDCVEIDCVLMEKNDNGRYKCREYDGLLQLEKIAEAGKKALEKAEEELDRGPIATHEF